MMRISNCCHAVVKSDKGWTMGCVQQNHKHLHLGISHGSFLSRSLLTEFDGRSLPCAPSIQKTLVLQLSALRCWWLNNLCATTINKFLLSTLIRQTDQNYLNWFFLLKNKTISVLLDNLGTSYLLHASLMSFQENTSRSFLYKQLKVLLGEETDVATAHLTTISTSFKVVTVMSMGWFICMQLLK